MKHLKLYCFSGLKKIRLWFYIRQDRRHQSSTEQFLFLQSALRFRKHGRAAYQPPLRGHSDRAYAKIAQPAVKRQLSARDISDIPPQVENGQAKTGKLNIFQLGNDCIY